MLLHGLRLALEYLGHGQEPEVLEVLVGILDVQPQLGHTELCGVREGEGVRGEG